MRRILFAFLFISGGVLAQTHNDIIWSYVDSNVGTKVGDGDCLTLIRKAYDNFCNCNIVPNAGNGKGYMNFGKEVSKDSVIKGDVVLFISNDTLTKIVTSHIGVIYGVYNKHIDVAHQNYNVKSKKDSLVEITDIVEIIELNPEEKVEVLFYRPF